MVLLLYLVHAIRKCNAVQCFSWEVVMGQVSGSDRPLTFDPHAPPPLHRLTLSLTRSQGRLPVNAAQLDEHLTALATALSAAIARDFGFSMIHGARMGVDTALLSRLLAHSNG